MDGLSTKNPTTGASTLTNFSRGSPYAFCSIDALGRYHLKGLPHGTYTLRIGSAQRRLGRPERPPTPVKVTLGENEILSLDLIAPKPRNALSNYAGVAN